MPTVVLTFSVLAGKVEVWRRFRQEMSGSWQPLYEESRRRIGIKRELLELMETSTGSAVKSTLEVDDVGLALSHMLASELPFDSWYRAQMEDMHAGNLENHEDVLQPWSFPTRQELVFEWALPQLPHDFEAPLENSAWDTDVTNDDFFAMGRIAWAHREEFPDYSIDPDDLESQANVDWTLRVAFLETPLRLSTLIMSV